MSRAVELAREIVDAADGRGEAADANDALELARLVLAADADMEEPRRANAADELRRLMLAVWQRPTWGRMEYDVWASVCGESALPVRSESGRALGEKLADLSAACSGWWRWDADTHRPVFVPMAEWLAMFVAWKEAR